MKTHSTNYQNAFIAIADDSIAAKGEVPADKDSSKIVAGLQFEMISKNPYRYASDEVLFSVHTQRNEISRSKKSFLFQKTSMLTGICFR